MVIVCVIITGHLFIKIGSIFRSNITGRSIQAAGAASETYQWGRGARGNLRICTRHRMISGDLVITYALVIEYNSIIYLKFRLMSF